MNYIAVKQWMLGEGLKISQVAAAAGVSPTTITLTLQNKRFGSYRLVRRALRKLKCPAGLLKKEQPKGRKGGRTHRSAPTGGRSCG